MSFAKNNYSCLFFLIISICTFFQTARGDNFEQIISLSAELRTIATTYAEENYRYLREIRKQVSTEDQLFLYRSFGFAAQSDFFFRLLSDWKYSRPQNNFRINTFNSFSSLSELFRQFKGNSTDQTLRQIEKILDQIEKEFSKLPDSRNWAYLHLKYVQARDRTIYLIERLQTGYYVKRPFKNLESLFRYNYNLNRSSDPWKYLQKLSEDDLKEIETGPTIELNFETCLVIGSQQRVGRVVYLIQNGKRHPLATPLVLERLGGWKKVLAIPEEIILSYPEGAAIE